MRRLAVLFVLLCGAIAPTAAVAAPPGVDLRGTWALDTGASSTITWTSLDCATGAIAGSGVSGTITWPEKGTLDGVTLSTISGPYSTVPAYTYYLSGTFDSPDHASGTFKDTYRGNTVVGDFTLTRLSGPPSGGGCSGSSVPPPAPGPAALHPTATRVQCTYVVLTSLDTCTAVVGDAFALPTSPTGTVTFGKSVGGFIGDGTCVLQTSPSAPSTGSCSVTYQRPFGSTAFPNITAAYGGDASHGPSDSATSFLILGGPPSFSAPYPNQVRFETVADADGTSVTACATTGSRTRAVASDVDSDLEELTRRIQQADDALTTRMLPMVERQLTTARAILERNQADYQRKILAGDRAGAAKVQDKIKATTKAIEELSEALGGQCRAPGATASAASVVASAAAAKRKQRTAIVLATKRIGSAKAGRVPITLKLSKAKLKQARRGKKTLTVYVHVTTRTPSGLLKKGWPRTVIYKLKVKADGTLAG